MSHLLRSKMRTRFQSASALVYFFLLFLLSSTSSLDLPTALNKSEVQETQGGREGSSRFYKRIDDTISFNTSKRHMKSATSSTHHAHNFEDNDASGTKPKPSNSTEELCRRMKSSDGLEWMINNKTLSILNNDPQMLIDCTKPGDRVTFNLKGVHKFNQTLVVYHNLEFIAESPENDTFYNEKRHEANFTCPDDGPFLRIKSVQFSASGFTISNCTQFIGSGTIDIRESSNVTFNNTRFINNQNRAISVSSNTTLTIENCYFKSNGVQSENGGAICAMNNAFLSIMNSFFYGNTAKSGGAIYGKNNVLFHILYSNFNKNQAYEGGGVALFNGSRLFCMSSVFNHNSANRGGGLYISSVAEETLLVQLTTSSITLNHAYDYGGGIAVKTFGIKNSNCSNIMMPCDRIILDGTSFVRNSATFGSIIVVTKLENILVNCDPKFTWFRHIMSRNMIQERLNQGALNVIDRKKLCSSWKKNCTKDNQCKDAIGTFGRTIDVKIDTSSEIKMDRRASDGHVLSNVKSGSSVINITLTTIDDCGNTHAPTLFESVPFWHDSNVTILKYSSGPRVVCSSDGFSQAPPTCVFENGKCIISDAIDLASGGYYRFGIDPRDDDPFKPTNLTIVVRDCAINEGLGLTGNFCRNCGETSYNFNVSSLAKCVPCPKNANCTAIYMKPHEGYWHKSPCHDKVKKCIVKEACKFQDRTDTLIKLTKDLDSCNITNTTLAKYEDAQCNEGYEGPLCGTCKNSYGFSSNFECKKCGPDIVSVLSLIAIACFLLFGISLIIRGVLPLTLKRFLNKDIEATLNEANTSTLEATSNIQPRETIDQNNDSSRRETSQEGARSSNATTQQKHEIELAKRKILEAWKILLNFLQITSATTSMDVKWPDEMLDTFKKFQAFSEVTVSSISRPIDCLLSSTSRATRAIWRTLFSLFAPTIAIAILATYWGYRSILIHGSDNSYFSRRFVLTIITTIYITYFDLTQMSFKVFNCVKVYKDLDIFSKSFTRLWTTDTSIECYKGVHDTLIGIGVVVMILVSIGVPLFCVFAVSTRRNELTTTATWAHDTSNFLRGPYKHRFKYWECVIMIKKAILSIIIAFSYSMESQTQALLLLIFLVFFLYAHVLYYPYDKEYHSLNYYESGSLLVSCVTYTLLQFFTSEQYSKVAQSTISISTIAINVGFVLLIFLKIIRLFIFFIRTLLRYQHTNTPDDMNLFFLMRVHHN